MPQSVPEACPRATEGLRGLRRARGLSGLQGGRGRGVVLRGAAAVVVVDGVEVDGRGRELALHDVGGALVLGFVGGGEVVGLGELLLALVGDGGLVAVDVGDVADDLGAAVGEGDLVLAAGDRAAALLGAGEEVAGLDVLDAVGEGVGSFLEWNIKEKRSTK